MKWRLLNRRAEFLILPFYRDGFASIHFKEDGKTFVRVNTIEKSTKYSINDSIINIGNKKYKILYLQEGLLQLLNVKEQEWPITFYYSRVHPITNYK